MPAAANDWAKQGDDAEHVMNDPEHWRRRAAETRALAENAHDAQIRKMLLQLAEEYDRLAQGPERHRPQE